MRSGTVLLLLLAGCPGPSQETDDTDTGNGADAICSEPAEIACEDELYLDLSLHDEVTEGEVDDEQDGDDFVTVVDATAGGFGNETENPWVYVKFTETGAERVDITDEEALESMEWHIAARRYILRLNGGSSGPSCVGATAFLEKTYDEVTEVPDGTVYAQDDFYTEDCTIVNDSSGLEGSPQVVLGPWWEYPDCVATTGHPFLIQLEDGRVVKFVVEAYYAEGQENCNDNGTPGSTGGMLQWRWRFM